MVLKVDIMYGCMHCLFDPYGCIKCLRKDPMVTRTKAKWDHQNPHVQKVPDAPVFHPTEEEFKDPASFIASIGHIAQKYLNSNKLFF